MPRAHEIQALKCPQCDALCDDPGELELDDVVFCDGCQADLVVTGVSPVTVAVVEEVDDDEDLDDEDEDEEDLEDEDEDIDDEEEEDEDDEED